MVETEKTAINSDVESTKTNVTGSETFSHTNISHSLDYNIKDDERHFSVLYKKVEELSKKINDIETKKIIDESHIPPELLESNGLLPQLPIRFKRGKGYRPVLKSEVEEAKKQSVFTAQQAKWLGISQQTYKKYAKMYGLYEPRPNEKGKRNLFDPNRGKYPLKDILSGKFIDVSDWVVKDKLIRSHTLPPKCNMCGYSRRRIVDNKICLLLDHKDGDMKNFKLENLQLLCLNCTFEAGRGYIRRGKHSFDVDWIQGARKDEIDDKTRW